MSNSSGREHNQNLITQKLFEHQIIRRFDDPNIEQNPFIKSMILRLHGFGVVNIVGIDIRETQVEDLEIKINHGGFDTQAQVWIKIHDGTKKWNNIPQF
jgi:hypothetical protein